MDAAFYPNKPAPQRGDPAQPSLFDLAPEHLPRPAYQPSSPTSKAAAEKAAPKVRSQQLAVLTWLDRVANGTRKECAKEPPHGTGLPINVVTPRVHELIHELGLIREVKALLQPVRGSESVVPERRDGSAVLVLTREGKEYLDARSAA